MQKLSAPTLFGISIFMLLISVAILAPFIAPITSSISPLDVNLAERNLPPFSTGHILGTDHLGRDLFSQAVWGARASLCVGIAAAFLASAFGSLWGGLSALLGKWADLIMMRFVDGMLAIPGIVLILLFQSLVSTPSLVNHLPQWAAGFLHVTSYSYGYLPLVIVIVIIAATSWLEAARLTRAQVLAVLSEDFIEAAVATGIGKIPMLLKHLLPNAQPIVVTETTLLVSDAVLMEAGLGFLGLGLSPDTPSWGHMLGTAQAGLIEGNWWSASVPGILIATLVLAVNLIGQKSIRGRSRRAAVQPSL
jgi:peptide/nickel transport system permease protein